MAAQAEFYRLTPHFQDEAGAVTAGVQTYVMSTHPSKVVVAVLPKDSVSVAFAQQKERELMEVLKTDVIVSTRNIQWLKAERLTSKEVAALLPKGAPAHG